MESLDLDERKKLFTLTKSVLYFICAVYQNKNQPSVPRTTRAIVHQVVLGTSGKYF